MNILTCVMAMNVCVCVCVCIYIYIYIYIYINICVSLQDSKGLVQPVYFFAIVLSRISLRHMTEFLYFSHNFIF